MRFAIATALLCAVFASALFAAPQQQRLTYKDVKPIFDAKCVSCHGAQSQSEGLRLDTHANILKGGEHGKVVIAGNSAGSKLMKSIKGAVQPRMPLGAQPLTQAEMEKISKWITQGARR